MGYSQTIGSTTICFNGYNYDTVVTVTNIAVDTNINDIITHNILTGKISYAHFVLNINCIENTNVASNWFDSIGLEFSVDGGVTWLPCMDLTSTYCKIPPSTVRNAEMIFTQDDIDVKSYLTKNTTIMTRLHNTVADKDGFTIYGIRASLVVYYD